MTAFDFMLIGIIGLSTVLAFVRGFVRVVVSLATWVLAVFAALRFSEILGAKLPDFGEAAVTRYVIAFALILIGVLVVGALFGYLLSRLVRAVGLGFLDRFLGALVGFARGVLIAVIVVLFAGLTKAPRTDWWQNSRMSRPLKVAALALRPWLPKAWAERLDYDGREHRPAPAVAFNRTFAERS